MFAKPSKMTTKTEMCMLGMEKQGKLKVNWKEITILTNYEIIKKKQDIYMKNIQKVEKANHACTSKQKCRWELGLKQLAKSQKTCSR